MDNDNLSKTTNKSEKGADIKNGGADNTGFYENAPKRIITKKRIFTLAIIVVIFGTLIGVVAGVVKNHYYQYPTAINTEEKTANETINPSNAPQNGINANTQPTNVSTQEATKNEEYAQKVSTAKNKNKKINFPQVSSHTTITKDLCMNKIDNSFFLAVALGNYEQMCPDRLKNLCESVVYPSSEGDAKLAKYNKSLCDWICSMVHISSNDSNYFNNIVLNWGFTDNYQGINTKYTKIDDIVISSDKVYTPALWRVAIAYRVDKNRANEICNIYGNDSNRKELCLTNVQNAIKQISDVERNCGEYIKQ